ncbi:MAG: hypothetical protein AAGJ79_01700 [Verrucomicrobiota bacterium]
MIEILLTILGIYLLIGLLIAVPFAFIGAKKIDPAAVEGTWGFKLLVIPGAMVFWPMLLKRWMQNEPPPIETSAHR